MKAPPSDPAARASGSRRFVLAGRGRLWLWAAAAMTLFRLWLTASQTLHAIGGATHDDRLFLNLAASLLRGEWLGPYNNLTLAKGPFYSLWIALVFLLGVPLMQAQQLLYTGACALTTRAFAPVIRSGWARCGLYALLLWNPMSFDAQEMSRVLRQNLSPSLALMLFAAMVALYVRRAEAWRRLAPWAVALGLTWAAFWLTREDGVWLVPSLCLLGAAHVIVAWRQSRVARFNVVRVAATAGFCALAPLFVVCALNARAYGWFGTVEFRAATFKDAYGALLRVQSAERIPFVPVTRSARERIYAVSPAFAELRPYLEGTIGRDWATISSPLTHRPPEALEIGGGWFMWALRQSVEAAGHGRTADDALNFYARLAREVNEACARGRLPAGPPRSGFLPPWQAGQTAMLARTLGEFADFFVSFRRFSAYTPGSEGSRKELDYFRDLTRARLSTPTEALGYEYALPYQQSLAGWKLAVLQGIGKTLRPVLLVLGLLAQAAWLMRAAWLAWQRRLTYAFVLAAAAWGGCAACLLVCALVQVTSFPTLAITYLAPAYPLLLLFVAAVLLDTTGARAPGAHDASR